MSDILQISQKSDVPKWKQEELRITQELIEKLKDKIPDVKILLDPRGTFDILALAKKIPKVIAEVKVARQRTDVKRRTISFRIKNIEVASCRQLDVPILVYLRISDSWLRVDANKMFPNQSNQELADNPDVSRRIGIGSKSYAIEEIMTNRRLMKYLEERINET